LICLWIEFLRVGGVTGMLRRSSAGCGGS